MAVPTITLVLRQKDITKAGSLNPKFRLLYKRQSKLIASKIRLYKGDYAEDRKNPGQYKITAVDYADALNDSLKEIHLLIQKSKQLKKDLTRLRKLLKMPRRRLKLQRLRRLRLRIFLLLLRESF